MCVIFWLPAGQNIKREKLENAVNNNWHGYGIILADRTSEKLQVIKKLDVEGTDVDEVEKILRDNSDIDRYVHLRFATAGALTIENSHPFTSYYSDKEEVYFMHNGTLSDFKAPRVWNGNVQEFDANEASDSNRFNEKVISPMMLRVKGNINDDFSKEVIQKYWGTYNNRGILISKTGGHVLINKTSWSELEIAEEEGVKILCSNDDYFDTTKRGPVFEEKKKAAELARQEAALKEREVPSRASRRFPRAELSGTLGGSNHQGATSLGRPDRKSLLDITSEYFETQYQLGPEFQGLLLDKNSLTDEEIELFSLMTPKEARDFITNFPEDSTALLLLFTKANASLTRRIKVLGESYNKLKKASEAA